MSPFKNKIIRVDTYINLKGVIIYTIYIISFAPGCMGPRYGFKRLEIYTKRPALTLVFINKLVIIF